MDDLKKERIHFDPDREIMEADFSDLVLNTKDEVDRFYDRIEDLIRQTGRQKWFFLVNYRNCRIMPKAWLAHSLRGKRLNVTHSLGSVRFDASPETKAEIARRAGTEAFDANLFENRAGAVARIEELRGARPAWMTRKPTPTQYSPEDIHPRITFLEDRRIMEVDFSDFDFDTDADVNAVYDHIEARISATGHTKWYFLVNYHNCRIGMRAWIGFSQRGKRLNLAHSLGSVRYDATEETAEEIRGQAERKGFDANICATRQQALDRIAEIEAETGALAG